MAILMIDNSKRLILGRLIESFDYISGTELCRTLQITPKTLRVKMNECNDLVRQYGSVIESKTAVGYRMYIEDKLRYDEFLEEFAMDCRRNRYLNYSSNWRKHYMIRTLLISREPVLLERFEDFFYISRSKLNKEFKQAKIKLEDFDIKTRHSHNQGISLYGSEWAFRLCMLYEHKVFVRLSDEDREMEKDFHRFFDIPKEEFNLIESIILNNLSPFTLPYVYLPKLVYYVVLCMTRRDFLKNSALPKELIQLATNSQFYPVTRSIFELLSKDLHNDFCEYDQLTFTLLVGSYLNLSLQNWSKSDVQSIEISCDKVLESALGDVLIPFIMDDLLKKQFLSYILSCRFRSLSNVILDEETFQHLPSDDYLIEDLVTVATKYIREEFDLLLRTSDRKQLHYLFQLAYYRNYDNKHRGLNVIVCSHGGILNAMHICSDIQRHFSEFITSVEIVGYPQLFQHKLKGVHIVITDFKSSKLKSLKRPVIVVDLTSDFSSTIKHYLIKQRNKIYHAYTKLIRYSQISADESNQKSILEKITDKLQTENVITGITKDNINESYMSFYRPHSSLLVFKLKSPKTFIYLFETTDSFMWSNDPATKVIVHSSGKICNGQLTQHYRLLKNIISDFSNRNYSDNFALETLSEVQKIH